MLIASILLGIFATVVAVLPLLWAVTLERSAPSAQLHAFPEQKPAAAAQPPRRVA